MAVCPSCGGDTGPSFYDVPMVPTNSCLLVRTWEAAKSFPVAPLSLCSCDRCGFIFNAAWQDDRTTYSTDYEETQGFSKTFSRFHERLARDLIERHGLHQKRIVEIGCGKGEFLTLICKLGDSTGVGYDPSFVPSRGDPDSVDRVRFVSEFFDGETRLDPCDFVCCKMTLEHIANVAGFLSDLRRCLHDQPKTLVFFQVPNMERIMEDGAFWDIYYEHCSYFTARSLSGLFRRAGFAVSRVWTDYDDQYLMIEAYPSAEPASDLLSQDESARFKSQVEAFVRRVDSAGAAWVSRLRTAATEGRRTALWGSGSKAVSFLTSLGLHSEVSCAIDINPFRQGNFLPATGHAIIGPDDVPRVLPDLIVIMNPIYRNEVQSALHERGCGPEILTVNEEVRA